MQLIGDCLSVAGSPALHAALKPLEWLVGCWKSTDGFGHYPTIKDFRYVEQIEFFHVGQPNLQFMQVNLLHYQQCCGASRQHRGAIFTASDSNCGILASALVSTNVPRSC